MEKNFLDQQLLQAKTQKGSSSHQMSTDLPVHYVAGENQQFLFVDLLYSTSNFEQLTAIATFGGEFVVTF